MKTLKRTLSFLLIFCFVLSFAPLAALAQETEIPSVSDDDVEDGTTENSNEENLINQITLDSLEGAVEEGSSEGNNAPSNNEAEEDGVYYVSDKTEEGHYGSLKAAIEAIAESETKTGVIEMLKSDDATINFTIPVGVSITIHGNDKQVNAAFVFDRGTEKLTEDDFDSVTETPVSRLVIDNLVINGSSQKTSIGIHANGVGASSDSYPLYNVVTEIELTNSTIQNFKGKGIYTTNSQRLIVDNCKFENNGYIDDSGTVGDYAIDANLMFVQNAVINIRNSEFSSSVGSKAAIKVTQRGGVNDNASDVPAVLKQTARLASVAEFTVAACDFENAGTAEKPYSADIYLGSSPDTNGPAKTDSYSFLVTITNNTSDVAVAYRGSHAQETEAGGAAEYAKQAAVTVEAGETKALTAPVAEYYVSNETAGGHYGSLKDAIAAVAASGTKTGIIEMQKSDPAEASFKIPVGVSITIHGNEKQVNAAFEFERGTDKDILTDANFDSRSQTPVTKLSIDNLIINGSSGKASIGIQANGNGGSSAVYPLYNVQTEIELTNSTIQNFKGKAIYTTNSQKLIVENCKFENNGYIADSGTVGDYSIDANLMFVQDAVIAVRNSAFDSSVGSKAAIKVTQRGGVNDNAADVPEVLKTAGRMATVAAFTVEACDFTDAGTNEYPYSADIYLGSSPDTDGPAKVDSYSFPVTIANNTSDVAVAFRGSYAQEQAAGGAAEYAKKNIIAIKSGTTAELTLDENGKVNAGLTWQKSKAQAVLTANGTTYTIYADDVVNAFGGVEKRAVYVPVNALDLETASTDALALTADGTTYMVKFADVNKSDLPADTKTGKVFTLTAADGTTTEVTIFASAAYLVTVSGMPSGQAVSIGNDKISSDVTNAWIVRDTNEETEIAATVPAGYRLDTFKVGGQNISGTSTTITSTPDITEVTIAYGTTGGGSSSGGTTTSYTITASAGNGGSISPSGKVTVRRNANRTFTITPDEGYEVSSVVVDGKDVGTVTTYTFSKVTASHTITASFKAEGNSGETEDENSTKFTDIKSSDWYYDAVLFAVEEGLFTGVSETAFAPSTNMNRAMFVTVLGRAAENNGKTISGSNTFSDVASGSYYKKYVGWAAENNLVTGYNAATFAPEDNITREQMAVLLVRFADYMDIELGTDSAKAFTDAANVSSWAAESVQAASAAGIINGDAAGTFRPQGNATRAEVAQIFYNFLK